MGTSFRFLLPPNNGMSPNGMALDLGSRNKASSTLVIPSRQSRRKNRLATGDVKSPLKKTLKFFYGILDTDRRINHLKHSRRAWIYDTWQYNPNW